MSDPALSTRAPESDLYDEPISDEKAPQLHDNPEPQNNPQQPQLSDHCTTDRPLPPTLSEAPTGTISKWNLPSPTGETEIYISKPSDYPTTPAKLLLLLTNGTGMHSQNNQHQADMFARAGYLVIMPDLFAGDPAPNSKPEETSPSRDASWLDTVKLKVAETAKSFGLDMWLARHTPETTLPIIRAVLAQAREEFSDAVSHGDGIYAVGYCFGGKYVLRLAGKEVDSVMAGQDEATQVEEGQGNKGPEIRCGVCAHGTLVGREDFQDISAPVQLVCVEDDPLFPGDVLDEGRKVLGTSQVEHEIDVYPGVPHGFAVVGEYESKTIMEAQSKVFDKMVRWLDAH